MLLPAPSMPLLEFDPAADDVADVVGEDLVLPLRELEAARRRAEESLAELAAGRPSGLSGPGRHWVQAEAEDVVDAAAGLQPDDGWRTAGLLAGDAERWADANVAVAALETVRADVARRLDRQQIARAAGQVAAKAAEEWAQAAEAGWTAREDRAVAWLQVRAGEAAIGEFVAARRVGLWAVGHPERRDETELPPSTQYLPEGDPVAVGHWLSLELSVDPTRWLRLPVGVTWPEGSQRLLDAALDGTKGFVALREHGVFAGQK